ncbi:MAG: HDIG domain-containing protein [Candidatus Bathyarchaeota archaeon]|nr:HDIG domain-containing protein [Candidatus Bathyarchaeota archaeon]
MRDELMGFVDLISDEELAGKVREFLVDPPTGLDVDCLALDVCPGGAYQHHSYSGGLLEHTVSVVRVALVFCDIVEELYGGEVNRDTVVAGAVLHDVMKCYCYEDVEGGGFRGSDFGGRVDHLTLMVGELMSRGFPLDVVHVVAAHHGDVGPTKPKSLEALIVSIADLADSEFNGKLLRAAEYLLRRGGVSRPRVDSAGEAVMVVQVKEREGWVGVDRLVRERVN